MNLLKSLVFIWLSCCLSTLTAHATNDTVNYIRFRPDGKTLLIRSINPFEGRVGWQLNVVNSINLRKIRTFPTYVLFSPDNLYYIAAGHPMRSFDLSGRLLQSFMSFGHVGPTAISPDGKTLVGGGESAYLGLWDVKSGASLAKLPDVSGPVYFNNDSQSFYISADGGIALMSVQSGMLFRKLRFIKIPSIFVNYDVNVNKNILCAVISYQKGDVSYEEGHVPKAMARFVLMDTKGKFLAKNDLFVPSPDNSLINVDARISRDGRYIAIRHLNGIRICSVPALRVLRRYQPKDFGLRTFESMDFSPVDNRLAIGGWGKPLPVIVRLP